MAIEDGSKADTVLLRPKTDRKCKWMNAMFALLATGAAAATSIAELGKNGNLNARWSPICSHFSQFCIHGGLAILASFIGSLLLMILNALSVFTLYSKVSD
ncbi:hypothetical protein M5K25_013213 [Dendrobium thyrsiflorum]|uniref:CASP-like protein n=1 Tax=Dendrobium thyrsiflorum TaxID=117978 RepID=A0ABD0USK6_DENTH